MGQHEFDSLERKNQLNEKDLIWYMELLLKKGILNKENGEIFKGRILGLFREEVMKKPVSEERVKGFFKRGENE